MQRWLRLQHTNDFRRIRETGRAYHHAWLTLSLASGEAPTNRYGFITAKKLGNAVIRNRVRRRLKEVFRLLHPRLLQGYDMVIIARPKIVGQPFHIIQSTVEKLCEQAGIVVKDIPS